MEIIRLESSDEGTFGVLLTENFSCFVAEPPWRDNKPDISCIPAGEYEVELRRSPKFGLTYWIKDVPKRSYILQHTGNYAGDKTKGFKTHTYGCQLLGKYRGILGNQKAVLLSRPTIREFIKAMKGEPYKLLIREAYEHVWN